MERRQFVKLAGMTSVAATAGLAGCQDGGGGDGDETTEGGDGGMSGQMAPYNSWLASDAVANPTELLCVTLDTQALEELSSSETASETPGSEVQGDALFALPSGFLFIGAFAAFGFSSVGLGSITQGDDSPTNTLHIAGGGLIAEGDFDPDSLASSVETAGLSESEEYNGYTIYEGQPGAAALSDSAVVVANEGNDLTGRVKSHIDANAGDATLYSDEARITSGAFEVTYRDRQPWDTPGPPGATRAEAELTTSFTDPAGNEYELDLDHVVKPPFPPYETGGGVITDAWHHGPNFPGSPMMPRVYTYGAFWGVGDVIVNGEVATDDGFRVIHFMTTQTVRDRDYRLAIDEELPPKAHDNVDRAIRVALRATTRLV